jgi:hypothetical protein
MMQTLFTIQVANVILTIANTVLICANLYYTRKNLKAQRELRAMIDAMPRIEIRGLAVVEEADPQKPKYDA